MNNPMLTKVGTYLDELTECLQRFRGQSEQLHQAGELIAEASSVCTLGVGKSGYIAQKMAASLRSIGVMSDFVHAAEALHGDLGRLHDGVLTVVFSKSGNSEELKTLVPLFRKRRVRMLALTNRPDSPLGKAADLIIDLGVHAEGDHLGLLPLISTDVSLVAANIIVGLVAERRGLTPEMFRETHPGGQLGFAVGLALDDLAVWKERRPVVQPTTTVLDAALVMSKYRAGIVCVTDSENRLLGILSDGDLRSAVTSAKNLSTTQVCSCMNRTPRVLSASTSVADALAEMELGERKVFAAPVLDTDRKFLGVVVIHDLVR